MRIDCKQCEMYQTSQCDDCLVAAVLRPPADVVEVDEDLDDSLRALSVAGLIPVLKFRPRPDPPPAEAPAAVPSPPAGAHDPVRPDGEWRSA